MFNFNKKKSSDKKLSDSEIEQLMQQLEEKKEEYKSLYNKLVEAGCTELPDDILDIVAGGVGNKPKRMSDVDR